MKRNKHAIRGPETGLALVSLIIVMLILGVVGYTFVTIVSTHRYGLEVTESSLKAFYIKEGAFRLGQKYIKDLGDPVDPDREPEILPLLDEFIFIDEPMGDGTFSVWITQTDIVAFRYSDITATANVPY
jgi:hypothetical protein